jgi:hypothetical protein
MRKSSIIAWLSAALLTACGGANTLTGSASTGTPTGASTVTSVTVTSSVVQISADGSDSATITAVAKDANNNFVSGVTMTFAATTGGGLAVTQATTDANGAAIATLKATAGATVGTAITVTASTNNISGTANVNVVNTQETLTLTTSVPQIPSDSSSSATITALVRGSNNQFLSGVTVNFTSDSGGLTITQGTTDANGQAKATLNAAGDLTNRRITVTATAGTATATIPVDVTGTRLTVTGPANLVQGSQGTYTVSLIDSSNNGIPNKVVTLTSAAGNTLSAATVTTTATGQGTFIVTGTNGGSDTITAAALGLQAKTTVTVSSQSFAFTAPAANAKVNLGAVQTVSVTWTSNGVPQVGNTVSFSTTRGALSAPSAVTDASGVATVTLSSNTSGTAIVTASATGVTAQTSVDFIATNPSTIAVQASPTSIPTQGQSTIIAVVRDPGNNLVEGQTVDFTTVNDITGGTLTVASAVTDASGTAQTVYAASATPSSSNGVTVKATVQGTAISASTNLTVGGQTVSFVFGTGNQLGENTSKTQFIEPYSVQALDSSGHALNNVTITLSVHSATPAPIFGYYKGFWSQGAGVWVQTRTASCTNEDQNLNFVLDPGEDVNGDGVLWPGDVAAVSPGTVVTANNGSADFTVVYPEDHAAWVRVKLTASATVQGTASTGSTYFDLPILAAYVNNLQVTPPGAISPYGIANSCANPN